MSEARPQAVMQTRQSIIRVWLALSAVWMIFWFALASLATVATGAEIGASELSVFALIVTTPPLALLAIGVLTRWLVETLFQ